MSDSSADTKHLLTKRRLEEICSTPYDACVIGSGISGLVTAGLLSRCNGWRVLVLEQHTTAGGCSHTFEDHDLEYDVGVHYVGGHVWEPTSAIRKLLDYASEERLEWNKLDDVYDVAKVENERFEMRSGRAAQQADLSKRFPDQPIAAYFDRISKDSSTFAGFVTQQILSSYLPGFVDKAVLRNKYTFDFKKAASKTVSEVLDELGMSDPVCRAVVAYLYGDYGPEPSQASWAEHAVVVSHYLDGSAYPVGGSSSISKSIIPTIVSRNGDVVTRAPVEEILVENSKIRGVRVKGREILCKVVVSAIGASNSLKLLKNPSVTPDTERRLSAMKNVPDSPSHAMLFVEIEGNKQDLHLPTYNLWVLPDSNVRKATSDYVRRQSTEFPTMFVSFPSAKDPTWESRYPSRSVAEVVVEAPYGWFEEYSSEPTKHRSKQYEEFKNALGMKMLDVLKVEFPQVSKRIVRWSVGTPLSSSHYLASRHGVSYGVAAVPARFASEDDWMIPYSKDVKGLFFTGQDLVSCGVMGATMSAALCASTVSSKGLFTVGRMMLG